MKLFELQRTLRSTSGAQRPGRTLIRPLRKRKRLEFLILESQLLRSVPLQRPFWTSSGRSKLVSLRTVFPGVAVWDGAILRRGAA